MATVVKSTQYDAVKGAWLERGTFTVTPGSLAAGTGVMQSPGLVIGSTDTQIGSVAFTYRINGTSYAKAAVAAGTAIGAQTVTADKWALYRLSIGTTGTITVTAAAGNAAGYATEALAIAALPATPANQADMGYITVKTKAATNWVAATDALAGGASGNPASVTNYYSAALYNPEYTFNPDTSSPNCQTGDQIWVQPRTLEGGLFMKSAQVSGANTVQVVLRAEGGVAITGAQQTYDYILLHYS